MAGPYARIPHHSAAFSISVPRTSKSRSPLPACSRRGAPPEQLRFHDLRHTTASLFVARGANPKQIVEHLGHSTICLTFDRYGHLFDGHDVGLLDAFEDTFAAARVPDPCPEDEDEDSGESRAKGR